MNNRGAAIKVGFLTLVSLILLISVVLWLRGRTLFAGDEFTVVFSDVDGLKESAPVHLMGIRVGFVDAVEPFVDHGKYRVKVTFNISHPELSEHETTIPRGSRLTIQQSGLIGEKFLEITPPGPQFCTVADTDSHRLKEKMPVIIRYASGPLTVGSVRSITRGAKPNERLVTYLITQPNIYIPLDASCDVTQTTQNGGLSGTVLEVMADMLKQPAPNTEGYFTVEPPMRLKAFLDVQMETAEALRDTNLKISQLLTQDTIDSLTHTVENTEQLTARATELTRSATDLVRSARSDVRSLVKTVDRLSVSLTSVSNNINDVIKDDEMRADFKHAVSSIRSASASLDRLLNDPDLKQTLVMSRRTVEDTSQIMGQVRGTTADPEFQREFRQSVTLLNQSLVELKQLMGALHEATGEDSENLKKLIDDARGTVDNLHDFSEKLDGHFVLWRLLF